ncbi:MAG: caspase family protein [Bacteroidota bacterium]
MNKQMPIFGSLVFLWTLLSSTPILAQCTKGNCYNGYGTFQYKSGARYKGDFRNGQRNGKGLLFFSNGNQYVGEWRNNHRQGKGKLTFANGDVYQGNFVNNQFHGHGLLEFANGNEYDGEFKDGQIHGTGTMTYANGEQYVGSWQADKRHGTGKLILVDGNIQEGNWVDDHHETPNHPTSIAGNESEFFDKNLRDCNRQHCASGRGYIIYANGAKYVGEFKNGQPEGQGICYYKNGDRYEGEWKHHAPNGQGTYTYKASGRTVAAIWNGGRPIRPLETLTEGDIADFVKVDRDKNVKIWSVVVGVSTYTHMPALRFTDDDAYRFYAFLKSPEGGALANDQIRVLIDEDATHKNILNALKETLLQADENDVIVFYYSGHGLAGSFIPVDYDGFNNRLMHDEIKQIFDQSKAKHKMIFADACYSGSLLAMKSPHQSSMRKFYQSFERTKGGLAFFTSSKGEEISLEDGGLRQGIFTHFLIRGLNGEADTNYDKIVTIKEIFHFVSEGVRKYTAKVQTPVLTGDYDTNMPVAVFR